MNILQALFFPPEQPGGVSSMVPYIQERFNKLGWPTELFLLAQAGERQGTGSGSVSKLLIFGLSKAIRSIDKYLQTYRDYVWWTKLRMSKAYDLIHAHHPIPALVMKQLYPDTPLVMTIHSSYERELILNGKIEKAAGASFSDLHLRGAGSEDRSDFDRIGIISGISDALCERPDSDSCHSQWI